MPARKERVVSGNHYVAVDCVGYLETSHEHGLLRITDIHSGADISRQRPSP